MKKMKQNIQELWDNFKKYNMRVIGRRRRKKKWSSLGYSRINTPKRQQQKHRGISY